MQVSIIIVNYNTLELTKNTISSILSETKKIKYEIILVDNNSQDGSVEFFSNDYYKKKIKFIKNNENLGFGKANNIGINIAKGKYLFLLNSDTLLLNNVVKILYKFMEKNPKIGISGGNIYDVNRLPAHSYSKFPDYKFDLYEIYKKLYLKFFKKRLDFNYSDIPKKVGYITGADMFIRKELVDKIGNFDPEFFMYFEETELTWRAKKIGYEIYSVPEAKIIHLEGKSFVFKETRFRMMCQSKYIFLTKVYGKNEAFYNYILSQFKYLIFFNKNNKKKFEINKEEYLKNRGKL